MSDYQSSSGVVLRIPSIKRGKQGRITQILLMQRQLLINSVDPYVKPADQARSSLAWERLEERRMALAGEGKPKSVTAKNDTQAKPKRALPPVTRVSRTPVGPHSPAPSVATPAPSVAPAQPGSERPEPSAAQKEIP